MGLLDLVFNGAGNGISKIELFSYLISASVVVFIVMPVHEYAHAFAANKLGDPTARDQGRLTMNPMAHIDYFGALMIYLVGFGWARAVRVDSRYFDKPKRDMALTAFAGPLSNLCFAFCASILISASEFIILKTDISFDYFMFLTGQMPDNFFKLLFFFVVLILQYVRAINISLALFNLIPIPPLDGSKVLFAILPDRYYWKIMHYERYFSIILMVIILMISRTGVFGTVIYNVESVFDYVTWFPFDFFI